MDDTSFPQMGEVGCGSFYPTCSLLICNVPKSDMHANPKNDMHANPKSDMQTLKVRCMQTLKVTCKP